MILSSFEERWLDVKATEGKNSVKRVNNKHVLDIYIGYDVLGRHIFVLLSSFNPRVTINSKSISVESTKREDGRFATCFTLIERMQEPAFFRLCWDLFEYSSKASNEQSGVSMIQQRFKIWQKLLQKGSDGLLENNVIKGLIGELLFLYRYCIPNFGVDMAINSWIGLDKADKDFVFSDTWYEVKALDTSAVSVNISSLEQLESKLDGYLVFVFLNKTSYEDTNRISLYMIVEKVRRCLADYPEALIKFDSNLIKIGYLHKMDYDNLNFTLCKSDFYLINQTFPKISKSELASGIGSAKYTIDISAISNWRIADESI